MAPLPHYAKNLLDREVAACLQAAGYSIASGGNGLRLEPDLSRSKLLVFDVDAAGIDRAAAEPRRCDVRLVGLMREANGGQVRDGLSAVLVLRALTSSRLLSCIRAVRDAGGSTTPEALCQMLAGLEGPADEQPDGQLTEREFDVLRLLADGDTTRDIAKHMSYSERTVKNIVHDLLAKLNCRTRAQAVATAARRGVI